MSWVARACRCSAPERVLLGSVVALVCGWALAGPAAAQSAPPASSPPASYTIYPLPDTSVQPYDLAVGPDGNLWTPYNFDTRIAQVTPSGTATQFQLGFLVFPRITTGSDGNLWMLDLVQNSIDKITPAGVLAARYPFAGQGGVGDVTLGPDGNVWFTEPNSGQIGGVTPSGVITEFDTPSGSGGAIDIVAGSDGNLWFTDEASNKIGRITPSGAVTEFPSPSPFAGQVNQGPLRITNGPDGNLWYTDQAGTIGRITPSGAVTQFVLPTGSQPAYITAGPDGNLWFTDTTDDQVGRLTPGGQVGLFQTQGQSYGGNIITGPDGRLWLTLGGRGSLAAFQAFAPAPSPPDVRSLSPRFGPPSGGTQVTITGYDVGSATQVLFGSTPATSFSVLGPGQILAVAPPHAVGQVAVTVVTPDGTTAASSGPQSQFYYQSPQCGKVITQKTNLQADIGPCYSDGVEIRADNITFNLGGYRIFGFPVTKDGNSVGVNLQGRTGVTVKNGTVSNFDAGVVINRGGSNSVTNLTLKDNIGPDDPFNSQYGDGLFIDNSSKNYIARNTITNNGIFDGIGIYDPLANGNTVEKNTITNTVGPSNTGPSGEGIIINGASGNGAATFITGTIVQNNVVSDNASAGIANTNEERGQILDNTVNGNGTTNSIGNGIGVSVGYNWDLGDTQMLIQGNTVHGNGVDGIRIGDPFGFGTGSPTGNKILDNNAANNAVNPAADTYEGGIQAFDLDDLNANCANDVWSGNIWGSAGYSPACTATGGSGPAPAAAPASKQTSAASPSGPHAKAWTQFLNRGRR